MKASFEGFFSPSQDRSLWEQTMKVLEENYLPAQLRAWIQPLQFIGKEEQGDKLLVHIEAPNAFFIQWVQDHFKKKIESILSQLSGKPTELNLLVRTNSSEKASSKKSEPSPSRPSVSSNRVTSDRSSSHRDIQILDPRYLFENFVVGSSNQFAHAAAYAVSEHPAEQYNPLFIYSSPGLGKTHLLYAIGNRIRKQYPKKSIGYLSAEVFVNELIESIQHRKTSSFRARYRNGYDVLLIDDIQFIAGRQKTEEEFFHTFNALYGSKRQIILTSDHPPKEIKGLEERIRTRFEWGLVVDIQPPEIETRIAILKSKAEQEDIYLPDEVATFVATHIKTSIRELEGILIRLQAQASLTGAEISLEMAQTELKDRLEDVPQEHFLENIQTTVAHYFKIRVSDLFSLKRNRSIALPRQIAIYLIRKYTDMGLKEIADLFGRDHTTVIHACQKIEKAIEKDPIFQRKIEKIQNLL